MALPIPANTTCAIYRAGTGPPAAPVVKNVPCFLQCDWRGGQEAGEHVVAALVWTHVMLLDVSVDIRDAYSGQCTVTAQDTIYIPDETATGFLVVFIERLQRGTAHEHKRVFLDRKTPTWPSNDL